MADPTQFVGGEVTDADALMQSELKGPIELVKGETLDAENLLKNGSTGGVKSMQTV